MGPDSACTEGRPGTAGWPGATSVLLISGSLRRRSVNSAALRIVRALAQARPGVSHVSSLPIGQIPFYDADVEACGLPDEVREAKTMFAAAGAVIIATPAYNGAPPGVLKNALDWLSRPPSVLRGKVVATLSASPGRLGAQPAQVLLRQVLSACGALLVEHEPIAIANAVERCGPAGEFTDPQLTAAIDRLLDATLLAAADAADAAAIEHSTKPGSH